MQYWGGALSGYFQYCHYFIAIIPVLFDEGDVV